MTSSTSVGANAPASGAVRVSVRRLNTPQTIQEGRIVLEDASRHFHALRTLAPPLLDVPSLAQEAQQFMAHLDLLQASGTSLLEAKQLKKAILNWRRGVQLQETSYWRSLNSKNLPLAYHHVDPSQCSNRSNATLSSIINRPQHPANPMPLAPIPSSNTSTTITLNSRPQSVSSLTARIGPLKWSENVTADVRALQSLLPHTLIGSIRAVSAQLAQGSSTMAIAFFLKATDAMVFDNIWNLQAPPGYENVAVQLVEVED